MRDADDEVPSQKARALRGTAGTFCGRRPPKDPASRAEFESVRVEYYVLMAKDKEEVKKAKADKTSLRKIPPTMIKEEYYKSVSKRIASLKEEMPGPPGLQYVQMACQQMQHDR